MRLSSGVSAGRSCRPRAGCGRARYALRQCKSNGTNIRQRTGTSASLDSRTSSGLAQICYFSSANEFVVNMRQRAGFCDLLPDRAFRAQHSSPTRSAADRPIDFQ
jgi:hypothetical protein